MPSRVLETVLTGRNLLSPVLTTAAADVTAFDAKVAASQEKASTSAETSARAQVKAADQVVAANAKTAASSSEASAKVTAANTRNAETSTSASSKVVSSNARAAESSRAFADVSESSAARAGVAWSSLASKALPLAGAAAVVVFGKMAGDYQQLVTKLATTAGAGVDQMHNLGQGMLDMAGQVGISATELAKGMYTVESSLPATETGAKRTADALLILKASAQGARQENADLGKVTDAVSTILHDYHLPASQAATVTSQLVTAVSHGKTTFDELTGSLHSVTPLASKLHVSLADITGTLSAMTASGESADQATQNMADTLRHLMSPTGTMTAELAQLGITSSDLSDDLSTKGLAGTLQLVERAIVDHMDPATKRVLLPALNASKTAAADLKIMMGSMPPELAKASQSLLTGSTSITDYQKAAKSMGGTQGAMALQFLSLYKNSDGFNSVLKQGGPAAQAFTAAMAKSFGTASALNVALMTTGENAAATNASIKDIGKATADVHGNIKGWAEVQGNFNQKLAQAGAEAKTLAIEAGQHLLPVLTNIVGWVGSTGLPAIGHLGSAVGDVAHWFSQLPGPVKTVAEVLGGLALANAIGLFGRLARIGAPVISMFKSIGGGASSMSMEMRTAFGVAKAAQMEMLAANGLAGTGAQRLMGNLAGIGSAAGAAAKGGLAALGKAGSGLINMFGGPWVVATAGVVLGFVAQSHAIDDWAAALQQGGDAAATATAQMQAQAAPVRSLGGIWSGITGGFKEGISQLKGYSGSLDEATQKAQAMRDALSPMARAQQDVTTETNNLNRAVSTFGVDSAQAKEAAWRLGLATGDVATNQAEMDRATRGANGALLNQISLQEQLSQAGLSSDQANLSAIQAIDQYKASLKDANLTESSRRQILNDVAQSMFGVLDAAKRQADAETKGLPAAQVTNQEIVRQRDALNAVVKQLGFVPDSLKGMYDSLNGPTAKALVAAKTHVDKLGTGMTTVTTSNIPGLMKALGQLATAAGHTVPESITGGFIPSIKGAGDHAVIVGKQVFGLGTIIDNLPKGHNTKITADTTQADNTIAAFMKKVQADGFVGALYNLKPMSGGGNGGNPVGLPPLPRATGGPITGPGSGTSDSVLVAASNGEHMWTAAETVAAGGHSGVEALRRAVLAAGHGLAGGGAVPTGMAYPLDFSAATKQRMAAQLQTYAASMSVSGGVERWRSTVDAVLGALGLARSLDNGVLAMIQAESGGNPRAINLTDSNAAAGHPSQGLMQTIPSTFYAYAGPYAGRGITDPFANIYAGVNYADQRWGQGILASGGRHSAPGHYIGYKTGTDFVPNDGLAYLHRGERVVPAERNFTPTGAPGYSAAPVGRTSISMAPPQVTVQARVFIGDREITDIVRVEATTVFDSQLGQLADTIHYSS